MGSGVVAWGFGAVLVLVILVAAVFHSRSNRGRDGGGDLELLLSVWDPTPEEMDGVMAGIEMDYDEYRRTHILPGDDL